MQLLEHPGLFPVSELVPLGQGDVPETCYKKKIIFNKYLMLEIPKLVIYTNFRISYSTDGIIFSSFQQRSQSYMLSLNTCQINHWHLFDLPKQ